MNPTTFLIFIGLIALIIAAVKDLKDKIIPNSLNLILAVFVLTFRASYAIFSNDFNFFIQGLYGYLIFSVIGILTFKFKIMGGGDAKLLMWLGPLLFIYPNILQNLTLLGIFSLLFACSVLIQGVIFRIIKKSSSQMPMAPSFLTAFVLLTIFIITNTS